MQGHQRPTKKSKIVVPLPIKQVGAGDVVKKVTNALGLKTCGPCEERRRRMNQALAFGRRSGR